MKTELSLIVDLRDGRLHLVKVADPNVEKQRGGYRLIVVYTRGVVPIAGGHGAGKWLSEPVGIGRVPPVMRVVPGELGRRAERLIYFPRQVSCMHPVHVVRYVVVVDNARQIRRRKHVLDRQ